MQLTQQCNKTLLIVNKSGGLIYSSDPLTSSNESLVLGSTIHSLLQLSNEVFTSTTSGLLVEYENHNIYVFTTLSKTFFIFLWDKSEPPFQAIYLHYAEKVMANYLYKVDMPINNCNFNPTTYF